MLLLGYGFSVSTLVVVALIMLLLFGNRLPSTMRSLGKGVTEFKKGLAGEPEEGDEASRDKQIKKDDGGQK